MRLRIGHLDFDAREMEPQEARDCGSLGRCSLNLNLIRVNPEQGPSEFNSTVIHEALHGMWHAYSIPETKLDEEAIVGFLEGPILAFLRDNPAFVARIIGATDLGVKVSLED